MRKLVLALAIAALLALPGISMAATYMKIVDHATGLNTIAAPAPGSSIVIDVYSVSDIALDGVGFNLTVDGGINDAVLSADAVAPLAQGAVRGAAPNRTWIAGDTQLSMINLMPGMDLGTINATTATESMMTPFGTQVDIGQRLVGTYTLTFNGPAPVGQYVVSANVDLVGSAGYIYGGGGLSGKFAPAEGANLLITPEPATALLLLGALPLLRRRR